MNNEITHNVKLTTEEIFELLQIAKLHLQHDGDEDLKSAYKKLSRVKMPIAEANLNYDYTPPMYGQSE
tara:strand:- start:433 stop:636 length:204 start_codon:yes stop_codon:yes gene_type:complete